MTSLQPPQESGASGEWRRAIACLFPGLHICHAVVGLDTTRGAQTPDLTGAGRNALLGTSVRVAELTSA